MKNNILSREIFNTAIAVVDPSQAVLSAVGVEKNGLRINGVAYELDAYQHIVVVGAGKVAAGMARAIEQMLGTRISSGLIIVKEMRPRMRVRIYSPAQPEPM